MSSHLLSGSLFEKNRKHFWEIEAQGRVFAAAHWGHSIIGESIFSIMANFAQNSEISLEILSYPFNDDELWAFTLNKQGTFFVCINTQLPTNKQIFAAAHELYHIFRYTQGINEDEANMASLLDAKTAVECAQTPEDIDANAFAGLLLMPDSLLQVQMTTFHIDAKNIDIDDILVLMDSFGIPYKAVVLRLYEAAHISRQKAEDLLAVSTEDIDIRSNITGKAKRFTLRGRGVENYGSLLENMEYNKEHAFLMESRIREDKSYLDSLTNPFRAE